MILTTSGGTYLQVSAGDEINVGGNLGRISNLRVVEFADIQEMHSFGAPSELISGMISQTLELEIMFFEVRTSIQEAFAPYCTDFTVDRQIEAFGGHFALDSVEYRFDPMVQGSLTTVRATGLAQSMADFLNATTDVGGGQTYVKDEAIQQANKASKKTKKAKKITRNQSRWEALEL